MSARARVCVYVQGRVECYEYKMDESCGWGDRVTLKKDEGEVVQFILLLLLLMMMTATTPISTTTMAMLWAPWISLLMWNRVAFCIFPHYVHFIALHFDDDDGGGDINGSVGVMLLPFCSCFYRCCWYSCDFTIRARVCSFTLVLHFVFNGISGFCWASLFRIGRLTNHSQYLLHHSHRHAQALFPLKMSTVAVVDGGAVPLPLSPRYSVVVVFVAVSHFSFAILFQSVISLLYAHFAALSSPSFHSHVWHAATDSRIPCINCRRSSSSGITHK